MQVHRETHGRETWFLFTEVTEKERAALEHLQYDRLGEGFGRTYPCDAPGLDAACAVLAQIADDMVAQAARLVPIPWERALEAFLEIIDGEDLVWWLTGSAALSVRGIQQDGRVIEPGDFDLVTDDASALRLGELMKDYVYEPVLPVTDWICRWWGRAFLHARFEWAGGLVGEPTPDDTSDSGPLAQSSLETVTWRGHTIRVAPLDMALATSRQRGLIKRVTAIKAWLADR